MDAERTPAHDLFDADEVRSVLESSFYDTSGHISGPESRGKKTRSKTAPKAKKPKPDHYEILCISMYKEDIASMDEKVSELKARGHRRMTRSALIRYALAQLDMKSIPVPAF